MTFVGKPRPLKFWGIAGTFLSFVKFSGQLCNTVKASLSTFHCCCLLSPVNRERKKHLSRAGRPRSEAEKQSCSLCTSTHAIHSVNSIQKLPPADICRCLELWADLANTQRQKVLSFPGVSRPARKKKKRDIKSRTSIKLFQTVAWHPVQSYITAILVWPTRQIT